MTKRNLSSPGSSVKLPEPEPELMTFSLNHTSVERPEQSYCAPRYPALPHQDDDMLTICCT